MKRIKTECILSTQMSTLSTRFVFASPKMSTQMSTQVSTLSNFSTIQTVQMIRMGALTSPKKQQIQKKPQKAA